MKEYLEKQTSDNYVSKADAAVQDGAVVKAANTIGDNVTKLDAALANGSTLIDIIKDSTTGMVSSAVTDGNISTGISQSAKAEPLPMLLRTLPTRPANPLPIP